MSTFRWLHLTDLHFGMSGQKTLWPETQQIFFDDLQRNYDQNGNWDAVFFTGDLVQNGTPEEYARLDVMLHQLWDKFSTWGCCPKLVAVPGNHDMVRPRDQGVASTPFLHILKTSWETVNADFAFWSNQDNPYREIIAKAFQPFSEWWQKTEIPKPENYQIGILPGEGSARFDCNGFSVGVVGLNSAFLQLSAGNFAGKLHLGLEQLHGSTPENNAPDWLRGNDVNLLLTHHPVSWLRPEAQEVFNNSIYPVSVECFAFHIFGHMHDAELTDYSWGGGAARRNLQGASLFGLAHHKDKNEIDVERKHGYAVGEFALGNQHINFRTWPRRAVKRQGGGLDLDRDTSFTPAARTDATPPLLIKQLPLAAIQVAAPQCSTPAQPSPALPLASPAPEAGEAKYSLDHFVFSVPFRSKKEKLIGREESLQKVRQQLLDGKQTAIGQTAIFQGLGGIGKTQLAVEYAYQYQADYPKGVIWLTADQDMEAQLAELVVKARWLAPETEHAQKISIACHRLRTYSDCLIVFDNLEDIETIRPYLPEASATPHILATSRIEQSDFVYVPVDLLDKAQSLDLLLQEANREMPANPVEQQAAQAIAERLDGLPLALELAGAYLARRTTVSWSEYQRLLVHQGLTGLPSKISSLTRHSADLYATLQISNEILNEQPYLRQILDVLTWSAAAPMSVDLLATLLAVENPIELTDSLALGEALRILQKVPESESYSLHRLVREVRRYETPLAGQTPWVNSICTRLADWFTALKDDFVALPRFEAELDHLREWHTHAVTLVPEHASKLTCLQSHPAFYRAQYHEAQRLIEQAQAEYIQHGNTDLALLAHLKNDEAYVLDALGNTKQALELCSDGLRILKGIYPESHPNVATLLNNLGKYHYQQGQYDKAIELFEQALKIREALFGNQHPAVATLLNNLGNYHSEQGQYDKAIELTEQALKIREALFGNQHPDVATSLNNLGSYHAKQGQYDKAIELAEQALKIQEALFGNQHPDVATSLNNLGSYHAKQGQYDKAIELAEQALKIQEALFGNQHPDVAISLNNLGSNHAEQGQYDKAIELAEQALKIQEAVFGKQHPNTATTLNNMSTYYLRANKCLLKAKGYAETAFAIRKKFLGSNHPDTQSSWRFLSALQQRIPGFRQPSRVSKKQTKKRK